MASLRNLAIAVLLPSAIAFIPAGPLGLRMASSDSSSKIAVSSTRRDCLRTLGAASLAIGGPVLFGVPAFAEKDVADGGLPAGALEFNRLLLSKQQVLIHLFVPAQSAHLTIHYALTVGRHRQAGCLRPCRNG
jgi:hypothetical protein